MTTSMNGNMITVTMFTNPQYITYNNPLKLTGYDYDSKGGLSQRQYKQCAVSSYSILNTVVNINSTNNVFNYTGTSGTHNLLLPVGGYSLDILNTVIKEFMLMNGDTTPIVFINGPGQTLFMQVPTGISINFSVANTFNTLVGFNPIVYSVGTYLSPGSADFSQGITSFNITCDKVGGQPYNNINNIGTTQNQQLLYTVPISQPAGFYIVGSPPYLAWMDLNTESFQTIKFSITDNTGVLLPITGFDYPVLTVAFR